MPQLDPAQALDEAERLLDDLSDRPLSASQTARLVMLIQSVARRLRERAAARGAPDEDGQLLEVQAGGHRYLIEPPLRYSLRPEGDLVLAEEADFHIYVHGEDEAEAHEEVRRYFAAQIEGYALEDDSRLAPSGMRLKQQILSRIRRVEP